MAEVWGEAEILVHIDGRGLPAEVRAATMEAAAIGGKQFEKSFKKAMSKATTNIFRDFARKLGDVVSTAILSSGAMRRLYEASLRVRTGFRNLGKSVVDLSRTVRGNLGQGFRRLGVLMRDEEGTIGMLREGARHLRIDFEDLRATFPVVERAIRGVADGFRFVNSEVRGFGRLIREDSIRTMDTLRDGAARLAISLDDVKDTFPGVTRALRGTRNAFQRTAQVVRNTASTIKSLGPDMEDTRPVIQNLRDSWTRLGNAFRNIIPLTRATKEGVLDLRVAMENLRIDTEKSSTATEKHSEALRRHTASSSNNVGGVRKLLSMWKRLPHGFRQAVFWTSLVISAMSSLSVLTSALGGTLISLITILLGLGAAAGIAVVGFMGLFGEGEKLSDGAKESKKAFEDLGEALHGLQEGITNAMFDNMADSIRGLTDDLLPALTDDLNSLAGVVGDSIGRIFEGLSSPESIETFQALLQGFEPIIEDMTTAIMGFSDAFADIIVASLPTAQSFADAIADVATQFSEWTSSQDGRDRIAEFFETAERIMPKVVELVVGLADALSGLVTEESIGGFETFIDSIVNFLPVLSDVVQVIGNLNIFGILAAAIDTVFQALEPLMPILLTFSENLGGALIEAIEILAPAFGDLGEALKPIVESLTILVEAILPGLTIVLESVVEFITGFVEALVGAEEGSKEYKEGVEVMGQVVETVFTILGGIIASIMDATIGILKVVADLLRGDFSKAFDDMYAFVAKIFENFGVDIEDVIQWFEDLLKTVEDVLGDIGRTFDDIFGNIGDWFSDLGGWITDAINWFGNLIGAANNAESASAAGSGGGGGRPAIPTAAGALVFGAQRRLIGEAGPEAVVPLRRPLSQVDPSVRALSAIAQGMPMAAGGIGGAGRIVNIAEGAIQINAPDPWRAATQTVNQIVERVG